VAFNLKRGGMNDLTGTEKCDTLEWTELLIGFLTLGLLVE